MALWRNHLEHICGDIIACDMHGPMLESWFKEKHPLKCLMDWHKQQIKDILAEADPVTLDFGVTTQTDLMDRMLYAIVKKRYADTGKAPKEPVMLKDCVHGKSAITMGVVHSCPSGDYGTVLHCPVHGLCRQCEPSRKANEVECLRKLYCKNKILFQNLHGVDNVF
jgi:hypothetical protein